MTQGWPAGQICAQRISTAGGGIRYLYFSAARSALYG